MSKQPSETRALWSGNADPWQPSDRPPFTFAERFAAMSDAEAMPDIDELADPAPVALCELPETVELEECAMAAIVGAAQFQVASLTLANAALRQELMNVRAEGKIAAVKAEVLQAQSAAEAAKKAAESKLGISLAEYHYDAESGCLRRNSNESKQT